MPSERTVRRICFVLAGLSLISLVIGIVGDPYDYLTSAKRNARSPRSKEQILRESAWEAAKEFIRDSLRSPSSAIFPALPDENQIAYLKGRRSVSVAPPINISFAQEEDAKAGLDAYYQEPERQVWWDRHKAFRSLPEAKRRWMVEGAVESQNGFGAMILSRFKLTMLQERKPTGVTWRLEEIKFEED